jgi:phage head maturation protease
MKIYFFVKDQSVNIIRISASVFEGLSSLINKDKEMMEGCFEEKLAPSALNFWSFDQ